MSSTLARKLLIKSGNRVAIVNAPQQYAEQLAPLPEGAQIVDDLVDNADAVHLFVKTSADLIHLSAALRALKSGGLLWIAYPKGGAKAGTDINRDILWKAVETSHGWTGVTLVAIDAVWSAMRFRPADQVRA